MIKKRFALLVLSALFSLALIACGAGTESAIATGIAQTQQISQLETAAAAPDTAMPEASATIQEESGTTQAITTKQDVNMRAGDSTSYGVMTVIPGGESLQVIGINQTGTWYQILYHDAVGWVSVDFTNGEVPANLPIATPSAQPQATSSGGGGGNGGGGGGNDNGDNSFLTLEAGDDQSRSVSGSIEYPGNDNLDRIYITVEGLGGNEEAEIDIAFQCETGDLDPSNVQISAAGATDNTICNNNWSHHVTGDNNQIVITVKLEVNGSNDWTVIANVSN